MRALRAIGALASAMVLVSLGLAGPVAAGATIPTTLTLVASPTAVFVGDTVTLTATVTPNPGACPVNIWGQVLTLNPATGSATATVTATREAHWQVYQASFGICGDYMSFPGFAEADVDVSRRATTTTLTSPSTIGRGDPFSVSVAVTAVPPTGAVVIREVGPTGMDGILDTIVGRATFSGTSPIAVNLPSMLPGAYALRAEYEGSTAWAPSQSADKPLTVTDRPTTTSITLTPNPADWGAPVAVDVQVSPVPDDGGVVRISVDGSNRGFATMNWNNGKGSFTIDSPGDPGSHTVLAEFWGSAYPISRWAPSEASKTLTVSGTAVDTDPPVGTVAVNGGAALVTSSFVTLTMSVTDASVIKKLQVSNDNATWATYGGPLDALAWSLSDPAVGGSATEGTRTVYVRWTDWFDNVGTASDSFTFDWVGPSGTVIIDGSGNYTIDTTVSVAVAATDLGSGVSLVSLSNDGTTWTDRAYAPTVSWALASGDGTKTVHVKWRDGNGHWSADSTDTIVLDTTGPSGTASIQSGAAFATSTSVTVGVSAADLGSGLSQVALSNDGTTWTTRAYAAGQAWTLPPTNGTRTVFVKWKDVAGNWSGVTSDTIVLDTVAPTATAPTHTFASGAIVNSGLTPTKFSWSGADATSGVARFEAAISTDGGAYSTISTALTTGALTRNLAAGHAYRLRVRAVDKAGLFGAYAYGPTFTVAAYQENSTRITYAGTWSRPASTSYWGGYEKYATAAGAKASFTFTGKAFAWIGCTGLSRGSAKIYVNGVLTRTISLYGTTTTCRKVLLAMTWSTAVSRRISIVVSGTAGHARVDLDALITGT